MKKEEVKEILKKCFGKEKDDRYHAIAMLTIYGIFILILVLVIRLGGSNSSNMVSNPTTSPTTTPTASGTTSPTNNGTISSTTSNGNNDINYSYSYTITYNGVSEVYLGKKIDDKEKFTLVKDGTTTNYAILDDNYLILENGIYHITEIPSRLFKYCDAEKILTLIENEIPTENNGVTKYSVSSHNIASSFHESLSIDSEKTNSIQLVVSNDTLKSIDLDLSNYLSSLEGVSITLTIHMEFADIGTTSDFDIKVS